MIYSLSVSVSFYFFQVWAGLSLSYQLCFCILLSLHQVAGKTLHLVKDPNLRETGTWHQRLDLYLALCNSVKSNIHLICQKRKMIRDIWVFLWKLQCMLCVVSDEHERWKALPQWKCTSALSCCRNRLCRWFLVINQISTIHDMTYMTIRNVLFNLSHDNQTELPTLGYPPIQQYFLTAHWFPYWQLNPFKRAYTIFSFIY